MGESATAPGAPGKSGSSRDQAWHDAVAIAKGSHAAQAAGKEIFYAVASTIAGQLRREAAEGLQRDLVVTRRQVADALAVLSPDQDDDEALDDGLGERFVDRTRAALRMWHADRKAAVPEPAPAATGAQLVVLPEGETLADLAARELLAVTGESDPVDVVEAVTVQIARELLELLEADPMADPDELLARVRDRVRAGLPAGLRPLVARGAAAVSRAVQVDRAWQVWEALQVPDEDELDRLFTNEGVVGV